VNVATSYNKIGTVYHKQGQYAEALEYWQKSLAIRIRVLGHDHVDVVALYNNIGSVYKAQGQYAEALEYHQKSLAIRIRVLGHDHVEVADSKYNMVELYVQQDKTQEARELLILECHYIYAQVYGADHEETLDAAR